VLGWKESSAAQPRTSLRFCVSQKDGEDGSRGDGATIDHSGRYHREQKGNMIDHVILTVSDFKRSVDFYAKALKPLGITTFIDYEGKDGHPDLKGFGDGKRYFFWLKEGKPDPQAVHVGFVAKDHSEVDAFYKAALAAGGKIKESPQARLEYYPGYYATWVLDPDGYDIEAVNKS
jgi:catechol 2,3-dioxygenase-like lactoylglutathione lyase family enzyme